MSNKTAELKERAKAMVDNKDDTICGDPHDMYYMVNDLLTALKEAEANNEWISADDRLPDPKIENFCGGSEGSWGTQVVIFIHEYKSEMAYFDGDDNEFWVKGKKKEPAKWTPLPNQPKE